MYAEFGAFSSPFWRQPGDDAHQALQQFLKSDPAAVELFRADAKRNAGLAGDPTYDPARRIFDGGDLHRFKVPSLRNVTRTPPYFHNGATSDLKEAIRMMAFFQLGKRLAEAEVLEIEAFLETLEADPIADWARQ
jgi:cytochrome c peroxidase